MNSSSNVVVASSGLFVGEAPGRLDFMGGVADYSGSLVLETPIEAKARVSLSPLPDSTNVRLHSSETGEAVEIPLNLLRPLVGVEGERARRILLDSDVPQWALYPLGCFLLFCDWHKFWFPGGLEFSIDSQVPVGAGVSSSAALEVATLRALEAWTGKSFTGTELARLAQRAENEVVGAPCGLMDQLASAYGQPNALLPILCRPDILEGSISLPEGLVVVGWPSGVKHAVSDSPYATARAAAFMGKKILETHFGISLDFLTELTPSQVRATSLTVLPETMSGREFLGRFGNVDDPLTEIDAERVYPVRSGALFPVEENFRCRLAATLLRSANPSNQNEVACLIGELMYQAHAGYTTIGLGCPETDDMVEAVRALGPDAGFYGARISGGGSGGTVIVFLDKKSLPQLQALPQGKATHIIY